MQARALTPTSASRGVLRIDFSRVQGKIVVLETKYADSAFKSLADVANSTTCIKPGR